MTFEYQKIRGAKHTYKCVHDLMNPWGLTHAEERVYYVVLHAKESPTAEQIAKDIDRSVGTVKKHLRTLQSRQLIHELPQQAVLK